MLVSIEVTQKMVCLVVSTTVVVTVQYAAYCDQLHARSFVPASCGARGVV
jgi:hypothetical protein